MKPLNAIPPQVDFTKPLDVLFQCHQKIAANLETLRRSVESLQKPDKAAVGDILNAINTVVVHFATAGIKHTADEEQSLFPRMRAYNTQIVSEVFDVVDQLEDQHKRAASVENSMNQLFVTMVADEELDSNKVALFTDLSESLYDLYRAHIQMENEFVFPSAGKILSAEELIAVGREMFQRRQPQILSSRS